MRAIVARVAIVAALLGSLAGLRASASAEATADKSAAAGAADRQATNSMPPATAPQPPDSQPVFRTGINTVRVDVIVTDRQGNPVTDLTLEDFEIQEDGKPQKAETFRLVKIDTVTQPAYTQRTIRTRNDEETAAADENSRIFAFFLDDYHVRKETSMSVKKPVIEFIANQLAPSDLVGVMYDGKLLMVETPENLRKKAFGGEIVSIKTKEWVRFESRKKLESLPFVHGKIKMVSDQEIDLIVDEASTAIPALIEACKVERIDIETIEEISPPFDDVFVKLIEKEADNEKII